ncbi:MAG: hypothetical protein OSB10_07695, partial [Planctomycetota bacterium]|nr:hypothetical protein [Planctomycetota bacterium]
PIEVHDDEAVEAPPAAELAAAAVPHVREPDVSEQGEGNEAPTSDPDQVQPEIQSFLALNRHPSSSRPLGLESFDLLNPDARYESRQALESDASDATWEVLFTADRYAVRGDETTELTLAVWRNGEAVEIRALELIAERVSLNAPSSTVRLSGMNEDDEVHARFTPQKHWPDYLGPVDVTASFKADGLETKTGKLAFYFTSTSSIPGHFTGEFDDRLENGNLVIDVGVEIQTPGRYRIEANLYDRHDIPVAWARFQEELEPGNQDVALSYHGLIFHDANASPPFFMRQLRGHRMRPGDSPHREDLVSQTGEWAVSDHYILSDFAQAEHQSPHKQKMVNMYEDARARGVRFTGQ